MKKIIFLSVTVLLFSIPWHGTAMARDVQLIVHKVECQQDEKIAVRYSVVNTRNFDYPNVSLCFKLTKDEKPVACRELRVLIPANADGSEIYQTTIEAPCGAEAYKLKSTLFHNAKRYKIDEWFTGCPGSWKSDGNDHLE